MALYSDHAVIFFLEEAPEHFSTLEEGLLRMEQDPKGCGDLVDALFRSAHSLKGSAGLAKLSTISAVAHRLEDTLEGIRDRGEVPEARVVDGLLFALDHMKDLVARVAKGEPEPPNVLFLVDQKLTSDALEQPPIEEADTRVQGLAPSDDEKQAALATQTLRIDAGKIESIMNLMGELTVTKTHLLNQLKVMEQMRGEVDFSGQRLLGEVARFSEKYLYALPEQVKGTDALISEFEDLEFDRYDEVNLFARKLQEISNDIHEALRGIGDFFGRFAADVEAMDRTTTEMKERVAEVRTIRASVLFQRFTRSVRELSRQSGRKLELHVHGGDTPIDRAIYDGLFDPLLHIVRNAVAHGFEPQEQRLQAGKPAAGQIHLEARRRGNTVEIEVRDDGRGIQLDRVHQRAIERGLMDRAFKPSERDLINVLFQPGFSTAESIDTTAGRGVGLNVVMDRLSALNGTIDVFTEAGKGTTFRLIFPLSLVIINVVQFCLGNQHFVIPSILVKEITDLPSQTVSDEHIEIRGSQLPLINLQKTFKLPEPDSPPGFAIIAQSSGVDVAMLVDAILSQEDTVIKPFGDMLRQNPHFSGVSIAGDGRLRLVLNPSHLLSSPLHQTAAQPLWFEGSQTHTSKEQTTVLVVDDSLSVRRYAGLLLENRGYRVLTATQGLEALEVLENDRVDFIISDLEMPVMHGYELLGELRRRGILERIPVAILSSRAGEAHVQKAYSLGAKDYLVKPFEEESLLAVVRKHTEKV